MKQFTLFLLGFLSLHPAVRAQRSYTEAIQKGDAAFRRGEYKTAVDKYFAAEAFDPSKKETVKEKVNAVFDKIERLRGEADRAKREAQDALDDVRMKNSAAFESFANLGARLIYTLDHEEALEKINAAMDMEVDTGLKRQRLTEPVAELLYFFAESGRKPALAGKAAQLLLQLNPEAELVPALRQCVEERWTTRDQFGPLLEKLPFFSTFKARYYPEFVSVPLGENGVFDLGSKGSEWKHQQDEQLHSVKLSAYQIASTPVTFYQFALFCEATARNLASRTPYWGRFGDHPVVNVNWYEAVEYANWLNAKQHRPPCYRIRKEENSDENNKVKKDFLKWKVDWNNQAKGCRLPTEAEWELAARGGTDAPRTLFAGSDTIGTVGWFWENSGDTLLAGKWDLSRIYDNNGRTHPVKQKKDNGIGIYDMCGNVYEWCWDWYGIEYYDECKKQVPAQNPAGPASSPDGRVARGGSWILEAEYCRTANRNSDYPDNRNHHLGFRLVFVP